MDTQLTLQLVLLTCISLNGYLTNLTHLDAQCQSKSQNINFVSELVKLTSLILASHRPTLITLTNLTCLKIDHTNRSDDLSSITLLSNLQTLKLRGKKYITDSTLQQLTNLRVLSLKCNGIITDAGISGLSNLTELGLHKTKHINTSLYNLTGLNKLTLSRNRSVQNESIVGCSNLTRLNLHKNFRIKDNVLVHLTKIKHLNLRLNKIITSQSLTFLTSLQYLNLYKNNMIDNTCLDQLPCLTYLCCDRPKYHRQGIIINSAYHIFDYESDNECHTESWSLDDESNSSSDDDSD